MIGKPGVLGWTGAKLCKDLAPQQLLVTHFRGVGTILKVGGPDINIEKVGPYRPKKWGGPTICFTLFPPKSGGARAPPAHTLTTPLVIV